jgi:hypothetical protein
MSDVDRIPALVFDDGGPNGAVTFDRALTVASRIVLATADRSPHRDRNIAAADDAGIPVEPVDLAPRTGIRHALALCARDEIYLAVVPHPPRRRGELLRKIVQAAADDQAEGLPVLAVQIVHPDAPSHGPVVDLDPAHADAGFAALFAAGLAGSTSRPLHIVRLAGDRSNADTRAADALHEARRLIATADIPVFDETTATDPLDTAVARAAGASAVVVGLGGFTAPGGKLLAPDELHDSVLESADGRLAHELARRASTDLVVVCDAITLHRGPVARATAVTVAVGSVTAGTIVAGIFGLAAAGGAVAAAAADYATPGRGRSARSAEEDPSSDPPS